MKRMFILSVLCMVGATGWAEEDKALAVSLCAAAMKLRAQGQIEKATDLYYRALANDEHCLPSLYELGIIFAKDGERTLAAEFLMSFLKHAGPEHGQRQDAARKLAELNPHAALLMRLLANYTQELNDIVKRHPDTLTLEEANSRADALGLRLLPLEKSNVPIERPISPIYRMVTVGYCW